jgi:4-diphosphocytidyl-2-C-methyl-D-erythritol kinase
MRSITREREPTVNAAAFMQEEYARRPDYASSMQLQAHAKLNLALAVDAPVPPSGYHPLCSWFVALDLADSLRIEPATTTTLNIQWAVDAPRPVAIDWPMERDLCIKALRVFESFIDAECPVSIDVHKRIPVGGGLGGGSSNAAATLRALRSLFAPNMTSLQLCELATKIGSDVGYFCDLDASTPRRAIVEGFGEIVTRTNDDREAVAVLIIPPFGCPTREVYARFDSCAGGDDAFITRVATVKELAMSRGAVSNDGLFNDLANAANAVAPDLADIMRVATCATGLNIHVTGSGSTCFALTTTKGAHDLVRVLENALKPFRCVVISSRVM